MHNSNNINAKTCRRHAKIPSKHGGLNVPARRYLEYIKTLEDTFVNCSSATTKNSTVGANILKVLLAIPPVDVCTEFPHDYLVTPFAYLLRDQICKSLLYHHQKETSEIYESNIFKLSNIEKFNEDQVYSQWKKKHRQINCLETCLPCKVSGLT